MVWCVPVHVLGPNPVSGEGLLQVAKVGEGLWERFLAVQGSLDAGAAGSHRRTLSWRVTLRRVLGPTQPRGGQGREEHLT